MTDVNGSRTHSASLGLRDSAVSCAKAAELIEMWTRVGLKETC